ncbi:MAG: hypothetical protein ACJAZN_001541 [Planctomycetota bacterium]|jgi:hypothetical protein
MSFVWEFLGNVLFYVVGVFLFCTGEALRFAFTLGRYRIRWWEADDLNTTWPSFLLGALFWLGFGALLAMFW